MLVEDPDQPPIELSAGRLLEDLESEIGVALVPVGPPADHRIKGVGFYPLISSELSNDHNYTFFGAQYSPCILESAQLRTSITGFTREPLYCPVG